MNPLDTALAELGPVPCALQFAIDVSYRRLARLCREEPGFAQYSVRTHRSLIHDEAWRVAHELLSGSPNCVFVPDVGTMVLRFRERYVLQLHKMDDETRVRANRTRRPKEIQGQSYLFGIGACREGDDVWLTVGHQPEEFTPALKRVVVGVNLEGGMYDYRVINPDVDIVASIGPVAAEVVARHVSA